MKKDKEKQEINEPIAPETINEQTLFLTKKKASKVLGIPESAIRNHVLAGRLKRCEHTGDRPWLFTMDLLLDFAHNVQKDLK